MIIIEAAKISTILLSLFFLILVQEKQSFRFSFQGNRGFNLLKNLRLQSFRNQEDQRFKAKKVVQVVIVGGGPAGMLSALTLLNRNEFFPDSSVKFRVRILESNENPRNTPLGPRSYPLGLGLRGQYVLQSFEQGVRPRWRGLWEKVQQIGIESDRLFVHINRWKLPIRQPADPSVPISQPLIAANTTKSLLIQRNRLCSVLLDFLLEHFPTADSQRTPNQEHKLQCGPLTIDFQTKISAIDFSMRSLQLSTGECVKYDLLLGCDGVNSIVRRSLQTYSALPSLNSFKTEEILLPWQFKVMVQPIPPTLESDAIHAFPDMSRFFAKPQQPDQSSQGFSLFAIPTINQQLATVINWKRDDTPSFLNHSNLSDVTPELQREVEELFERQYPSFGKPSLEAVGQLVRQRASNIRKVRCNCYHNTEARVALVGDAVHATDATWGQGLSATFLDIAALDQCLTECRDDLTLALPRYSEKQVREGLALWQLIALPPKGLVGLFYSASEIFIGLCRRLPVVGRLFPLPIQYLISKTIMPYSEIVKRNEYWTNIATEGQEKFEYMAKE